MMTEPARKPVETVPERPATKQFEAARERALVAREMLERLPIRGPLSSLRTPS